MVLYLSNDDVRGLLSMSECLGVVEDLFRQTANGEAECLPGEHLHLPKNGFHRVKVGLVQGLNAFGLKTYAAAGSRPRYLVMLYDLSNAALLAIVEARDLGQIRTGAAGGVAVKYMARPEAESIGIIGTGWEARAQIEAITQVRTIRQIKAYSRSDEKRQAFAKDIQASCGVIVETVDSAEECIRGCDIAVTITSARDVLLKGAWLEPGMHLNAIGATGKSRREIDEEAVRRATLVAVEDVPTAREESAELIMAVEAGAFRWNQAVDLAQIVSGRVKGRPSPEAITLYDAIGVGTEDIAAAAFVYQKARAQGIGRELDF